MIRKPTDEEKKGERGMGTSAGGKEGTNDKEDVKKGRREEEGGEGEDNNKTKRPWREGMKKSCSQEEMKKERGKRSTSVFFFVPP